MSQGMTKRMGRSSFIGEKRKPNSGSEKRGYAPEITKGNDFTVTIEELGHNGDGIVNIEGFTVIVPNTIVGEEVKIKIVEVKKTIAFAKRLN